VVYFLPHPVKEYRYRLRINGFYTTGHWGNIWNAKYLRTFR